MTKHLTFVKLGGAVITNKDIPESVRGDILRRLVREISKARVEKNLNLVIGNGAGSFAHVPAAHYRTMEGFVNAESRMGMAITQDSAARLNRLVVKACLEADIPALTLAPSNTIVTQDKHADRVFFDVLTEYLKSDMVPVVYGDVISDAAIGCTIWSTDRVFAFLARRLEERGFEVDQIIHVTEAHGVWKRGEQSKRREEDRLIYERITPANADEVRRSMVDTKGFDVTGGMWHKLEESLKLTELGIETRIISGLAPNALYNTLVGKQNIGTRITSK